MVYHLVYRRILTGGVNTWRTAVQEAEDRARSNVRPEARHGHGPETKTQSSRRRSKNIKASRVTRQVHVQGFFNSEETLYEASL
jgi:hypothetical protein